MLGVINVLKPTGLTSSDVVVKVRGMLRAYTGDKKIKVGHLGTLDPSGSGVLPIVFGRATRLFDYCVKDTKLYRACFVFGATTDTLDSDGVITESGGRLPSLTEIESVTPDFCGVISQIPPSFSSISVGGVRGYEAARQGVSIDFAAREVTVFSIDIVSYNGGKLWLDIACSGGTYIRSICRDIAAKLDTVAYMPCIIRLENKGFKIEGSIPIDILRENVANYILPIDGMLEGLERIDLSDKEGVNILNGVDVPPRDRPGDYLIYIDGKLLGICRDNNNKIEVYIRLWE